ncbi:hypothetical protein [Streptomyces sp. NBC_00151]|uniref:hypothetical protein n=1 Tax=Streptomyces sp. NBC_00151 TaxID=2975669 RepID=UPI002DD90DBC|nr:hypothetical protein [Streptomyces sp. NBC_00151]WRZ41868.1 hypothetical protein OG915_29815 [Streptomyces sp. NBC_00151]
MNDEQQPLTADPKVVRDWLTHLYGGCPGYLSICSDKDGWVGRRFTTDETGIEAAVQYASTLDKRSAKGVYAQSTTLSEKPAEGRGGEGLAYGLTHLWADGDYGTVGHKPGPDDLPAPPDAEGVEKVVAESGLPTPSGWVHTGGGYNPVWLLAENYLIGDEDDRAGVKAITTGVQAILAAEAYRHGWSWDVEVGNLDRLMKLPGTVNRKEGLARLAAIGPGTGEVFELAELAAVVAELAPAARETLEQAALEKQERKAQRTGAVVPPPRRERPAGLRTGDGPLDVLADLLMFRDVLEPAGWTYAGQTSGREKWLRPTAGGDAPSSAYSLLCDDHVAVNWSERSDLPVGAQPPGQKLTIGTLYAHLNYGGNTSAAASDIMRAAGGRPTRGPASRLDPAVLAEVKRRCLADSPYSRDDAEGFRALIADDPWDGPQDEPPEPPEDDSAPATIPGLIPEAFWAARPELRHIRQAGHSRSRSGDVALLAVLTRLSALVSHRIRADTGIADLASLNLFGAIVGPSGIGKSSGVGVASRLLVAPPGLDIRDGLPIGSGEGLAEVFMGMVEEATGEIRKGRGGTETPVTIQVRKQVRHHAFFYVDEGASLTRLMKERSGSTLGETLRSAAVGQTLGQTNASKDTSRYIPSGSYSMGLLVGFQPETAAPLFEEVAEGTPQRFVWFQVLDPAVPDIQPGWPGELGLWRNAAIVAPGDEASESVLVTFDEAIKAEMRAADLAKQRGQVSPALENPYDSQAPVMKVKLASLLAILAGRRHVNADDWRLANTLWTASCETRDAVIASAEAKRRAEQEKRTTARIEEEVRVDGAKQAAEEVRAERAVERLARRLALLTRENGPQTRKEVRGRTAGRDKRHLSDAFAYAVLREWVVEEGGKFHPGPVPPS